MRSEEIHFREFAEGDAVEIDMKKYAKPASFGALLVAGGVVALYALIAWGATPAKTGGIDSVHATIAYIGAAIPLAAIAAVHVVYARQLARYAREKNG